jgi:hypothetical protein
VTLKAVVVPFAIALTVDIMAPSAEHQQMRTTLTLDDDVAARLKAESRRAGRPFKEIVNETLRVGLASQRVAARRPAFKIAARDLGDVRPGLRLDNVAELIEEAEGPLHR